MSRRSRSPASLLVDCSKWRVPPEDARARLAERDQRMAADNRTEAQRFLGDPPLHRSTLAQGRHVTAPVQGPAPRRSAGTRVDLWRRYQDLEENV